MFTKNHFYLPVALLFGALFGWLIRGPGENSSSSFTESPRIGQAARNAAAHSGSNDEGRHGPGRRRISSEREESEFLEVDPGAVTELLNAKVDDLELRTELVQEDEPLAQLLNLTESEVYSLNGLWEDIHPQLEKLRMENAQYQRLEDGGIWLGVETFPEEGQELRNDFLQSTIALLGESRSSVFLDAIKAHQSYGQWGKTVGSGFAIRIRVEEDESYIYEIIEQARADGSPGRKWLTSEVPAHLQSLANAAGVTLTP